MTFAHKSVLLNECIEALSIKKDGIYLDATFGRGGHSLQILQRLGENGRLYAVDRDLEAIAAAKTITDPRFTIVHGVFSNLKQICDELNILGKVDGLLMDIGVSSPQLDDASRGFSFMQDGPLDMRMDKSASIDANYIVNNYAKADLVRIFKDYGEEKFAANVANAIIKQRQLEPIDTTAKLCSLIDKAVPSFKNSHKHKATRVFQALRIEVNSELKELELALEASIDILAPDGVLAIISFHSLEDRIVKRFLQQHSSLPQIPASIPLTQAELMQRYSSSILFTNVQKPIKAGADELQANARARSATLRVARRAKRD